jgi:RimJ/RimL family protein N-acetyltransferase
MAPWKPVDSAPRTFDLQPRLEGERIELRPLEPSDFDALYAAARDPLIWELHPEPTRHERAVFQRYFDGAIASRGRLRDHRPRHRPHHRQLALLQPASARGRDRLDVPRARLLGRHLQPRAQAPDDRARPALRSARRVRGRERNYRSRRALEKIGARLVGRMAAPAREADGPRVLYEITHTPE